MTYERPEIVCLCGSTRFIERMAVEAWELERQGRIVLSCHLPPHWYGAAGDHQAEAEGVAVQMDTLHLRKIDIADRVRIINLGGYIGERTRNEINYAAKHKKPISFLEDFDPVELDRLLGDGSVTIPSSSQTSTQEQPA